MLIVIDAYNLLKQRDNGDFIQESVKKSLIDTLSSYQRRKGHSILLVFDGGHMTWPSQEVFKDIVIVYAGKGKSADDYIKTYVAEHHKQDILLASSDRELVLWADKYDIVSIDSLSFYAIVKQSQRYKENLPVRSEVVHKTTDTENPVLDALMYTANPDVYYKDDNSYNGRKKCRVEKESRADRLLRKKLKKL
jgi:predicted RNA-binding protein with PIN domain